MRKLIVLSFISLDGVMQAPGGADEDRESGFPYGGWSFHYHDDESGKLMVEQIQGDYDLLLGRKTYDIFAGYWPHVDSTKNPIAAQFEKATKYVVTNHPSTRGGAGGGVTRKFDWNKTVVIDGGITGTNTGDSLAHERIRKLKEENGPALQVHGSGKLIQTLLEHDLVDELWLKTYPLTLGTGKKLFAEGTRPRAFALTQIKTTANGVIFANYRRAGDITTGTFTVEEQ